MPIASASHAAGPWSAPPACREAASWFFVLLFTMAAYQALYCQALTRGDMTGLFFIGAKVSQPPDLSGFSYAGYGYDGQMYRMLAHDPLARKGYWKYLDNPRFRARRPLVSLAAALLSFGSPRLVDLSYIFLTDVLLALGGVCFIRLAQGYSPPLATACLYLLMPAVVASTDRMVVDGVLMALFLAAWLFYRDRRTGLLMAVLAMAPLVRETGIGVTGGVFLAFVAARKYRHAAAALATGTPALLWWWFVNQHTPPSAIPNVLTLPLVEQVLRLFTPLHRPVPPAMQVLLDTLDGIACVCLLIALGWFLTAVIRGIRERRWEDDLLLALPFALLAAIAGSRAVMEDPYSFMRVNSALLCWVTLRMMRMRLLYAALYVPAASAPLWIFRASPLLRFVGQ